MTDVGELLGKVKAGRELRRLAQCGDIPAYRRRQLLAIAEDLDQLPVSRARGTTDMFADGFYRRPGLRLRLPPASVATSKPGPVLRLSALSKGEQP